MTRHEEEERVRFAIACALGEMSKGRSEEDAMNMGVEAYRDYPAMEERDFADSLVDDEVVPAEMPEQMPPPPAEIVCEHPLVDDGECQVCGTRLAPRRK